MDRKYRRIGSTLLLLISCLCPLSSAWGANCSIDKPGEFDFWLSGKVNDVIGNYSKSKYFYEERKEELEACIAKLKSPEFNKCTEPLLNFLKSSIYAKPDSGSSALGFPMEDEEYFKLADPYVGTGSLPAPLKTESFLSAMQDATLDRPASFKALFTELEKVNKPLPEAQQWKFIAFEPSNIVKAVVDEKRKTGRGMIYIPPEYFAHSAENPKPKVRSLYVQFTINQKSEDPTITNQLSVLGVTEGPNKRKEYYLVDHFRTIGNTLIDHPTDKKGANKGSCYACHSSGPIAIYSKEIKAHFPKPQNGSDGNESMLKTFNSAMKADSSISPPAPTFKEVILGDLGSSPEDQNKFSSPDFIKSCFSSSGTTDESVNNLKSSMKCSSCHNLNGRPRHPLLIEPFNEKRMVKELIDRGHMPPGKGEKLTKDEKEALLKCLYKVADERAIQSLKRISCAAIPAFNDAVRSKDDSEAKGISDQKDKKLPASPKGSPKSGGTADPAK